MPVISPKSYEGMQRAYAAELKRLADLAFGLYCQQIDRPLFLAGKLGDRLDSHNPRARIWAALSIVPEDDQDWLTIYAQPVPRHMTVECLVDWLRDRLRSEPLWVFAD